MGLTNKQRKFYKRLLEVKFDEMGIPDEILLVPTGKQANKVFRQPDAPDIPYQRPVVKASNTRRNTMKKLLRLSADEVERFLLQDFQMEKQDEVQETIEEVPESDT